MKEEAYVPMVGEKLENFYSSFSLSETEMRKKKERNARSRKGWKYAENLLNSF